MPRLSVSVPVRQRSVLGVERHEISRVAGGKTRPPSGKGTALAFAAP